MRSGAWKGEGVSSVYTCVISIQTHVVNYTLEFTLQWNLSYSFLNFLVDQNVDIMFY